MIRITSLFNLRPGEERLAALIVLLMLVTAIGNSVGVSGIEALFFARFGVAYLPLIYMIQGLLTLVVTLAVSAVLGGRSRNLIYTLMPLAMAGVLCAERLLTGFSWFMPIMWLIKEVMNSLMGLFVWGVASTLCDTRQAKRLFPLFNAGRILGAVVGGLGTSVLVGRIGTANLLIVWAIALGIAFVVTRVLLGKSVSLAPQTKRMGASKRRSPTFIHEVQRGYQFVRGSALMRWVSLAAVLFSALYFSLALPFSKAAAENFVSEDRIAGFLGLFNGLSTAVAFLASLFIANRLYTRFGIMNAILALPVIYLVGFGVLAVYAFFPALVVYKFVQMVWLSGIADSAYQAMFNTVPGERRDQVRAFIGGVPEQAGTFIAGFILIIGEQTLAPQQLYMIGLVLAAVCTLVIWRAGRAYSSALVTALRAGQPQVFVSGSGSLGSFAHDATAVNVAVAGISNPDPAIRRVAAEILGDLPAPNATAALVAALSDTDAQVRAASLKALAATKETPALLEVALCLKDPEPEVRLRAVEAIRQLAGYPGGVTVHISPLLNDPDSMVRAKAGVTLLKAGSHPIAKAILRSMAALGEPHERASALTALGECGDAEAFELIAMELENAHAPALVRRAAALALVACSSERVRAIPILIAALAAEDRSVHEAAATGLAQIGTPAMEAIVAALFQPVAERGVFYALEQIPTRPAANSIHRYAREKIGEAVRYHGLWAQVKPQLLDDKIGLLADSLRAKARHSGVHALRAINLLDDRATLSIVIDNLQSRDPTQRANALETLESVREAQVVRPLIKIWEVAESMPSQMDGPLTRSLAVTLEDGDAWIRACAALAAADNAELRPLLLQLSQTDPDALVRNTASRSLSLLNGGQAVDTLATLSVMERILFLRRVALFADLSPADLKQVAAIASEQLFADGDVIVQQGEAGDEMFVIVSGEVGVRVAAEGRPETEVARRKAGDVVGEMSIISQEPRMASLVAAGEVRTLCIDRKSFEGLLRERPETSLAVMRVLCTRLKELSK